MSNTGFDFLPGSIDYIPQEKYEQIAVYVDFIEAFSRLSNQCVYIADMYKGTLPYVSDNPLFLCGLSAIEAAQLGTKFNDLFVPADDLAQNREILKKWLEFMDAIPENEKKSYSVSYDYHIQKQLVQVTMTPTFLTDDGKIWITLCKIATSTQHESGNGKIFKKNSSDFWQYNFGGRRWEKKMMFQLSDNERQVINLSLQGYTETEIGTKIYRSKDTIKSIKRKLFERMEVSNITEAVSYAIYHGLI
jgi:DNA-binding CsgD family transcriptional regulator